MIYGNEKADSPVKVGAQEGKIYDSRISYDEYFVAKVHRHNARCRWPLECGEVCQGHRRPLADTTKPVRVGKLKVG